MVSWREVVVVAWLLISVVCDALKCFECLAHERLCDDPFMDYSGIRVVSHTNSNKMTLEHVMKVRSGSGRSGSGSREGADRDAMNQVVITEDTGWKEPPRHDRPGGSKYTECKSCIKWFFKKGVERGCSPHEMEEKCTFEHSVIPGNSFTACACSTDFCNTSTSAAAPPLLLYLTVVTLGHLATPWGS